jgi:hypothetical protein
MLPQWRLCRIVSRLVDRHEKNIVDFFRPKTISKGIGEMAQ